MPKETNAKAGLVKAAKEILQNMAKAGAAVDAYVLPPQGQADLEDNIRTAMDRMARVVAALENMTESEFTMIAVEEKADAKGHQSR